MSFDEYCIARLMRGLGYTKEQGIATLPTIHSNPQILQMYEEAYRKVVSQKPLRYLNRVSTLGETQ